MSSEVTYPESTNTDSKDSSWQFSDEIWVVCESQRSLIHQISYGFRHIERGYSYLYLARVQFKFPHREYKYRDYNFEAEFK